MSYSSPGVYIEEVSSGVKPIAGVGTSTAAFVGLAEKGDTDKALLITNWSQFTNEFGSFIPNAYLAYAVYGFFAEGGTSCYVVRVVPTGATVSHITIKDSNNNDTLTVTARSLGKWGDRVSTIIEDASDNKKTDGTLTDDKLFKLTIKYVEADNFQSEYSGEGVTEVYDRISLLNIAEKINEVSAFVIVQVKCTLPTDQAGIAAFKIKPVNNSYPLTGGTDNNNASQGFNDADFIGDASNKKGLHAFDEVDDISIVGIPDKAGDRDIIQEALNYCKNRKDCFIIADPPYGMSPTDVKDFKNATGSYAGGNAFNSAYSALYYPWIFINDPPTNRKKLVPPSGVVAGTYAYTDSARGVHKAPAGIVDGYLDSVVGIETMVTKGQHDLLNETNINVIRSLPEGICIWGARTQSDDSEWTYINIRRLLIFIERSIDLGSQWAVFEPNNPGLWGSVKRNLTAFLTRVWRDGALFGSTPEEAFFVKVDAENNPPEVRDAGQLVIEVGVAPVKPAEFVIIRISQKTLIQ